MNAQQTELRIARLVGERETTQKLHEDLLADAEKRDDGALTETEKVQIRGYRERAVSLDEEIKELTEALERHNKAVEESRKIRAVLSGAPAGADADGDGIVYRSMAAYARDAILSRNTQICSQIASQFADPQEIEAARGRLDLMKRVTQTTLSSDVAGLTPAQHIAEIFQVIDRSRPLVNAARKAELFRGQLTYPSVVTGPVVAVQNTQLTEAGDQELKVDMVTKTASTYLGGGELSWQAINWSTPDALSLWFEMAAADYALKTEQDAATIATDAAAAYNIASPLDATPSYEEYVAAIAEGAGDVYANSGRTADLLVFAPDEFYKFAALIPQATTAVFLNGGLSLGGQNGSFAGLRIVVSRGMAAGSAIVGDSQALLCAETAGAPVDLRVVEPAKGGLEVGIIGAFEAAVVDDGAFSLLTAAS